MQSIKPRTKVYCILLAQIFLLISAWAEVRPARIFSDHMVLQREQNVPVWGWSQPGVKISVTLDNQIRQSTAGEDSLWQVFFDPMPAGGPHELQITSQDQNLIISDILIGDVWLCSGQSNMELPLERSLNGEDEVAQAVNKNIRMFKVKKYAMGEAQKDLDEGQWLPCTPENSREITAVGYFFAREIQSEIGVPVGIIQSTWGGSRAEAWTEMSYLRHDNRLQSLVTQYEQAKSMSPEQRDVEIEKYKAWQKASTFDDPGSRMAFLGWADREFDHAPWDTMPLPGLWEGFGLDLDGSVWFRKTIEIPADWKQHDLILNIGFVDDYDMCFFNGSKIGETNKQTRKSTNQQRRYVIPGQLVDAGGNNTVAIRVFDGFRRGGIGGDPGDFYLAPVSEKKADKFALKGIWSYKIEHQLLTDSQGAPSEPVFPGWRHAPANLYNAMIAPLTRFALQGVIWYQGESNASRAEQYQALFPAMIASWRNAWQREDLPFYWVQLPNYMARQTEPCEGGWALIRAAQTVTTEMANTGMAITTDVGVAGDIHPRDKQSVGHRLALVARAGVYGQDIPASGPHFSKIVKSGQDLIIYFDQTGGGLRTINNEPAKGFGISNDQGVWFWAEARVEQDKVILHHPEIKDPVAACYNWANNPVGNLTNKSGLPADGFLKAISEVAKN